MDRAIIEGNKLVNIRLQKLNKLFHNKKIRNVSKAVDNDLPNSVFHPINKSTKEFLIEGKLNISNKIFRKMY